MSVIPRIGLTRRNPEGWMVMLRGFDATKTNTVGLCMSGWTNLILWDDNWRLWCQETVKQQNVSPSETTFRCKKFSLVIVNDVKFTYLAGLLGLIHYLLTTVRARTGGLRMEWNFCGEGWQLKCDWIGLRGTGVNFVEFVQPYPLVGPFSFTDMGSNVPDLCCSNMAQWPA